MESDMLDCFFAIFSRKRRAPPLPSVDVPADPAPSEGTEPDHHGLQMRGIDSLPFEIHQQILLYFRPPEKCDRHPMRHFRPFMSVCRQWRDVIVQTRLFWTTFHIKYHPGGRWYTKKKFEEFIPHLEVLVERSKDAPLDVFMNLSGLVEKECTALLHFFQKSAKLSQWKTLEVREFRSLQPVDPELLEVIPFQEFSGLKYLSLGEVRSFPFLEWLDSTGKQVSGLSLALQYSDVSLANLRDTFPRILSQVTELELRAPDSQGMEDGSIELPRHIFKLSVTGLPLNAINAKFVTHLSVQWMRVSPGVLNQFSLPRLEHFEVEQLEPWHNETIWLSSIKHFEATNFQLGPLIHFDFPSLETFRIKEAARPSRRNDPTTITDLFAQFKLAPAVVIIDLPIRPFDIKRILENSPRLREFRFQLYKAPFEGCCICSLFLRQGHRGPQSQGVSPYAPSPNENCAPLQHLGITFKWDQKDTISHEKCATQVIERYATGTLQSIQLEWEDGNRLMIRSFDK